MNKNVYLLAKLINSEANIDYIDDALYIGSVVLNRMRIRNKTMSEIVHEPNQFTGATTVHFKVTPRSLEIAKKLMSTGTVNRNVVYFYNPSTATNTRFINRMNSKTLVYSSKFHNFFKD